MRDPQSPTPWSLPPTVRRELPNGARLLAAESRASETVVISGLIIGGSMLDPNGHEGLANLTTAVAQRATTRLTYEQLYDRLDALGASFAMWCGTQGIGFRAKCLSRHWRIVAELVADILLRPSFPDEELARARGELLTRLRQLDDDTYSVADRELAHLVYPAGHPFRHPTLGYRQAVERLGRDDLAACHARVFRPDALIASVVGQVATDDALDALAGLVGDWPRPAQPFRLPDLSASHPPTHQRADFPMADKSQCDIALGFKGIPRLHPDFDALEQATQIVGGMGLMGRLGDNIRDRQGLAYYVYAALRDSLGDALWSVRAGVNPANVERAVGSILDELRRIQDEPVRDDELADVQSYLIGVLPIHLETSDGVAGALTNIELYGLGADFIQRYPAIVRAVTRDDVQRAAQAHLTAERFSLAVAGPLGR